jgi:hypothetical protein
MAVKKDTDISFRFFPVCMAKFREITQYLSLIIDAGNDFPGGGGIIFCYVRARGQVLKYQLFPLTSSSTAGACVVNRGQTTITLDTSHADHRKYCYAFLIFL